MNHPSDSRQSATGSASNVTHDGKPTPRSGAMSALRQLTRRPGSAVVSEDRDTDPLAFLLRRAGRGSEEAFAELYDRLAPLVLGIARQVLRDPAMSEEVTQEVFVELWRLAARHDEHRGSVTSWVATIARRRAIDRVRSEQSARSRLEREEAKRVIAPPQPEAQVELSLEAARVRRALTRLTEAQREAIELTYFGGRTYREAAVLLGVPEGTMKTRIRDAMIRLRDELGASQ
jgi:RNA polymerase sigma-70 factor, ECF subfamily